ncbi:hypothetical protein RI129_004778 [Pyrocoelia pectoralis]|uniref:Poly [ADP-ribose] polymerase n=1 Tax=Pyrocoelia pectoralis TaxID=417401 RepID=A0AAN7VHA3_9COLE
MENIISRFIPCDWSPASVCLKSCHLVELSTDDSLYQALQLMVSGPFNKGVRKIVRVENSYLWAQYLLRKEEYETKGQVRELELYHDTAESNITSIVETNFDWRRASRVKFGQGVSFSPSPKYANTHSARSNGKDRAFILAKVLVNVEQQGSYSMKLPDPGYDTTVGNCRNVYVKYYDDEFYPKYIIYYESG